LSFSAWIILGLVAGFIGWCDRKLHWRPVLLVLVLLLGASGARADAIYDITFTSPGLTVPGMGTVTTDGICQLSFPDCSTGAGLLGFTASLGAAPLPDFAPHDFEFSSLTFNSSTLNFEAGSGIMNNLYNTALDVPPYYAMEFSQGFSGGGTWTVFALGCPPRSGCASESMGLADSFDSPAFSGTYTITSAIPEPNSGILLATVFVLLGLSALGAATRGARSGLVWLYGTYAKKR